MKKSRIPWTALNKNPADFFPPELIPPGVRFKDHTKMSVVDRLACIRLWCEVGYLYVLQSQAGKKSVPPAQATAAVPKPSNVAIVIPATLVN